MTVRRRGGKVMSRDVSSAVAPQISATLPSKRVSSTDALAMPK